MLDEVSDKIGFLLNVMPTPQSFTGERKKENSRWKKEQKNVFKIFSMKTIEKNVKNCTCYNFETLTDPIDPLYEPLGSLMRKPCL